MQAVAFDGGRSRTRTCDLSHVSLSPNASFEQTFLENPKQTISSARESLPGFPRSCQRHTDKARYSDESAKLSQRRLSTTKKIESD
jgi:hypothetical protein